LGFGPLNTVGLIYPIDTERTLTSTSHTDRHDDNAGVGHFPPPTVPLPEHLPLGYTITRIKNY